MTIESIFLFRVSLDREIRMHNSERFAAPVRRRTLRTDSFRKSGPVSGSVLPTQPVFGLSGRPELRLVLARVRGNDRYRRLRQGNVGGASYRSLRLGGLQVGDRQELGDAARADVDVVAAARQRRSQVGGSTGLLNLVNY